MTTVRIAGIAYHLPETIVTNADLIKDFPQFTEEKIVAKTGILERRIAKAGECASDLAVQAAEKLFAQGLARDDIDYVLFCTQSPDSPLPTTACLIQHRLKLSTTCGALDFNLGCSGFVYGLGLAYALILGGQAKRVLLLTGDTYNKYIDHGDRGLRVLFGDGAAATIVEPNPDHGDPAWIFKYGTDGSGGSNLIVASGCARKPTSHGAPSCLFMNGPEIFGFTLRAIPELFTSLLAQAGLTLPDIDLFVFHQANQFMLEQLRNHLKIPNERFIVNMATCGNTVSSSIPIALAFAVRDGKLLPGMRIMLLGFGVGYSWSGTIMKWSEKCVIVDQKE